MPPPDTLAQHTAAKRTVAQHTVAQHTVAKPIVAKLMLHPVQMLRSMGACLSGSLCSAKPYRGKLFKANR